MQIQLKQHEIEAALRGYIHKQGIVLKGRTLEITFTSGRSGNGLTADISIEDAQIPGFSDEDGVDVDGDGDGEQEEPTQDAAAKKAKPAKPMLKAVEQDKAPFTEPVAPTKAAQEPEPEEGPVKVTTPVRTSVSLFN